MKKDKNYYVFSVGLSMQLINGIAGFINYRTAQQVSDFDLADITWGLRLETSW